jgi:hypothetical protein
VDKEEALQEHLNTESMVETLLLDLIGLLKEEVVQHITHHHHILLKVVLQEVNMEVQYLH